MSFFLRTYMMNYKRLNYLTKLGLYVILDLGGWRKMIWGLYLTIRLNINQVEKYMYTD